MVWKKKTTKNKNPYLNDVPLHGQKSETRVIKDMGAQQTIASGSIDGMKSDGVLELFRIECKSTVNKSISLKEEWLQKIRLEALETNRTPILTISFVDSTGNKRSNDWALIPLNLFNDFAEWYLQNGD